MYERYDYRIKYLNLKKTRSQNSLALEDVQRLWIPFLVFDNTERNEATKVSKSNHGNDLIAWTPHIQGTEDTELTLTREGDYIGSTDNIVEAIHFIIASNLKTSKEICKKSLSGDQHL